MENPTGTKQIIPIQIMSVATKSIRPAAKTAKYAMTMTVRPFIPLRLANQNPATAAPNPLADIKRT